MENSKKETKQKEREVYAIGRPSLEKLSKDEQKTFFLTLLRCAVEHFKENADEANKLDIDCTVGRKY